MLVFGIFANRGLLKSGGRFATVLICRDVVDSGVVVGFGRVNMEVRVGGRGGGLRQRGSVCDKVWRLLKGLKILLDIGSVVALTSL